VARILLIDDDTDLTCFLREELEARGHVVSCLERAEEGPDQLARTPFDLVLLDNKMPGVSGIEFLETLRDCGADVPVILMTGHSTAETAILATKLRAFDYVIKPDDFQTLARDLQPLIEKALEIPRPAKEVRVSPGAPPAATELDLIGKSKPMVELFKKIGRFADLDYPVLIRGETGTGKELVAQAFHTKSRRKGKRFVALNCTAINENLLESVLFGHEKGAFTGADKLHKGKIEIADGGTLFLDEIGDMPSNLQVKLLRVLERQEVERIGSNEPVKVNVRLVSATHRDLEAAIQEGKFREDLYHRLTGVTIRLPPLRERLDDLPELVDYFLARAAEATSRPQPAVPPATLDQLRKYHWPGNVRELRNVILRAFGVYRGPQILPAHLEFMTNGAAKPAPGTEDEAISALRKAIDWAWDADRPNLWPLLRDLLERELLRVALTRLGGNQTQVSERLDMNRGTVIERIKKYGLK
jgi:DNA-binding NtrC family response regulator